MHDRPELHLTLKHEPDGWRHYIGSYAVHCGSEVEIRINGQWLAVRYECCLDGPKSYPALYAVGGRIVPDADALYRRPTP